VSIVTSLYALSPDKIDGFEATLSEAEDSCHLTIPDEIAAFTATK
jgi:hypothetical protein